MTSSNTRSVVRSTWQPRYTAFSSPLCGFCRFFVSRQLEMLLDKATCTFELNKGERLMQELAPTPDCVLCTYAASMIEDKKKVEPKGKAINSNPSHAFFFPHSSSESWMASRIGLDVEFWCHLEDSISESPIWKSSESLNSATQLDSVAEWMKSCKETHEHCNALEDSLKTSCPTRLLEISQTIPRLVCPPAGAHLAYTALSHCWGGGLPIKTISSNFLDHQAGIDMSSLPQTYRDAITVSRRLGIDYIWIDSLCIIQDDAEDWAREASRMASVYEGAQITVVAAWGRDGSSGCFHHPKPTLVIEAFEKNNQSTSGTVTTKRLFLRPRPDTRFLKRSHLSTRAWTFQEVSLSRRVVVFSDDQLYWQCTTLLESEDKLVSANHLEGINNALPSLGLTIRQAELPTWDLYYEWGMACDAYARRQLTFPKDKFAALAGVTQVFQRATNDVPLAGLWKSHIFEGLLWRIHVLMHPVPDTEAVEALNIPSWSWLKLKCSFEFASEGLVPCVRLTNTSIQWSAEPLISKLVHASISGIGKIFTVADVDIDYGTNQCKCRATMRLRFGHSSEHYRTYLGFDECSRDVPLSMVCLVLYNDRRVYSREPVGDIYALSTVLLVPVSGASDHTYRRVGQANIERVPKQVFDDYAESEFILV